MDREFWWIRHGESAWNAEGRWQGHSDPDLNELGQKQSRSLAGRLDRTSFDAIYCSDLARAQQTARLALPDARPQVDPRLREINFGDFEGCTLKELTPELKETWQAWWRDPFGLRVPGGESMADLAERLSEWQAELPEEGRFAVFTHGGVIRCCLWQITGPPAGGRWTLSLDNTSLTRVRVRAERTTILCVNDCAHLE